MGELGEYWRDIKEHKREIKEKRLSNMPNPNTLLKEINVKFEVKNEGHHYIIKSNNNTFDYWPSTGYWKHRELDKPGYNISPLVQYIKKIENAGESHEH